MKCVHLENVARAIISVVNVLGVLKVIFLVSCQSVSPSVSILMVGGAEVGHFNGFTFLKVFILFKNALVLLGHHGKMGDVAMIKISVQSVLLAHG